MEKICVTKFIKYFANKGITDKSAPILQKIMETAGYKQPKLIKELYHGSNQLADVVASKEFGVSVRKTPKIFKPGVLFEKRHGKDIDMADLYNSDIKRTHVSDTTAFASAAKSEPQSFAAVYERPKAKGPSIAHFEYVQGKNPERIPRHITESVHNLKEKNPSWDPSDIVTRNIIENKIVDARLVHNRFIPKDVPHPTPEDITKIRKQFKGKPKELREHMKNVMQHVNYTRRMAYGQQSS